MDKTNRFSEKQLVEDYIIKKIEEKGWKFIPVDSLERESLDEPLLLSALVRALKRINKESGIGDEEINRVLNELKFVSSGIEGAKKILNYYKYGIPVKFEKEKVVKYVKLFDFESIEHNDFVVSRQVYYYGRENIRTDIMLYINGIPLVNIECKNPVSLTETWHTAYKQIKDYEKIVPELYKYVQIGIAAESIAKYFTIVPWQDEVTTYEWKCEGKSSLDSTIEMLKKETLIDIIKNYIFFRIEMGNSTKVITRYMQYRASNKIVSRVINSINLKNNNSDVKNKGLIWHWQGSGKTLTMIFSANKIYYKKELENPSIFFIVDRRELENQIYTEFNSLDIIKPEIINSVDDLRKIFEFDEYRGKRGVFITLIHKFNPNELKKFTDELEKLSETKETIMNRKNVIAFIDEGHRTQYGLLSSQMKSILKNAFFFAFTGTPISKKGRDTYLEFSYPPDEIYLDKYFITDSIRDGFTVKIVYQPRLEGEVHLKKDLLEGFLNTTFEEIPEEIREEIEEKVKKKLNNIKIILENPERIKLIAKDIATHFKENIDGKFKAMIIATSRKACDIYKKELDKHLPEEYSEIVMTYSRNDEQELVNRVSETRAKYGNRDIDDIRKDVIEKFKGEDFPKILIVTDMLLTGFDAPILQTIYLDKPLKEHRLLQALARTNRPYKDLKEAGIVIDYVGILKEFKRAMEMYDENDIKNALMSFDNLKEEFLKLIKSILKIFKGISLKYDRETLLKAIEIITSDKQIEVEFLSGYKNLRKVFELLGPDEIKIEYFEEYKWISSVFIYYMKVVMQQSEEKIYVEKYYNKTVEFIHKSTEIKKVETELPSIVFDEKYLEKLEEKVKDKKERAVNILFILNKFVLIERHKNPVYESLVEKVEKLIEFWKEKNKDYEKIYKEGVSIINEITVLSKRKKELNFSDLEYSMLLVLEEKFGKDSFLIEEVKKLSKDIKRYMFNGWINQITASKNVERELRRFIRGIKKRYNISLEEMEEIYLKLVDRVKNYGR